MKVLLVDDDAALAELLADYVVSEGHQASLALDAKAAMRAAKEQRPDLILLDQSLPDGRGDDLIPELQKEVPGAGVVIITAAADIPGAVSSMRVGADDYLPKPLDLARLRLILRRHEGQARVRAELGNLKRFHLERFQKEFLLLPDEKMALVYKQIERVASLEAVNILLEGETGSGKEHVARLVHSLSARAHGPFVEIHCGAVPEALLESELFGYEAGAFTGAVKAKPGLMETATGGTLFLDEVGEMPLGIQVKLLKVLEERRARRLGSTREIQLDMKVVAATNRDLNREVRAGRFRQDLFYRLNGFRVSLPPLRQRPDDLQVLAQHFLDEAAREFGAPHSKLPLPVLTRLLAHPWPGNVRELKNLMERLVITRPGPEPDWDSVEELLTHAPVESSALSLGDGSIKDAERLLIREALRSTGGNRTQAAKRLGITRKTLFNKLRGWDGPGNPVADQE
jgi:DNA-binding NtrC family response regulator